MACTVTVTTTTELGNGQREVRGTVDLGDVYLTGGSTMDLSAYLSGNPTVDIGPIRGLVYIGAHDGGTAAAGVVLTHVQANGTQVANAFNLATIVGTFVAVGAAV